MTLSPAPAPAGVEPTQGLPHVDVVIVGAGLSGLGAAYHLKTQTPEKSFLILEAMDAVGGTWTTHRYPGVRSDSDLFTFGYRFKPWMGPPIATADQILGYLHEMIEENDLAPHIRLRRRILEAAWSSQDRRWTLKGACSETGEPFALTAGFLWMCQGYYRHAQGYTPEWPGMEAYEGQIIHPQTWPEETDLAGKRVLVIGSGATAATLTPAIVEQGAHVTLLQRSPTYLYAGQNRNELVDLLRTLQVDDAIIHDIARRKALYDQGEMVRRSLEEPEVVKAELLEGVRALLGPDVDIAAHFTPSYRPWQQRIAFIPEADLFKAIASGKVQIHTDQIERFTRSGVRLASGAEIVADVVVTATGFQLSVLGDIAFSVDAVPVDVAQTITYRGMMFTGLANLVWVFGYFRASWTLRVDLLGDFVCRLLKHMDEKGARAVRVAPRPQDEGMTLGAWIDPQDFNPGYLQRGMHLMPRAGDRPEWRHTQDYWRERDEIPAIDLDGAEFVYE